jgi:PAS domain S-box-containing protein
MKASSTESTKSVHSQQELLERISELEQEVWNLQDLRLTIERNSHLFEALLEASNDGITLTRHDGTVIRVVRSIFGNTSSLAGLPVFEIIHPEDRLLLREYYRRINEEGVRQLEREIRAITPEGGVIWVSVTIRDMLDDPAVQAFVLNYRDITDLKKAAILSGELAAVIDHAAFAAFSKSIAGQILTWNRGAQEMFGYEPGEIVGQHISVLVPPELQEQERSWRAEVVARKTPTPKTPTTRLRKDGVPVPIELVLSPALSAGAVTHIVHLSFPPRISGSNPG